MITDYRQLFKTRDLTKAFLHGQCMKNPGITITNVDFLENMLSILFLLSKHCFRYIGRTYEFYERWHDHVTKLLKMHCIVIQSYNT